MSWKRVSYNNNLGNYLLGGKFGWDWEADFILEVGRRGWGVVEVGMRIKMRLEGKEKGRNEVKGWGGEIEKCWLE